MEPIINFPECKFLTYFAGREYCLNVTYTTLLLTSAIPNVATPMYGNTRLVCQFRMSEKCDFTARETEKNIKFYKNIKQRIGDIII